MESKTTIVQKIDDILWFDWDPIGINDVAPRDEYQSYVWGIYKLKITGASKEDIAEHLFELETKQMGLFGSIEKCLIVAEKIIGL